MMAISESNRTPFRRAQASLIARGAAWLGLACLLPIAAGCQAMPSRQKAKPDQANQAPTKIDSPAGMTRTDFHRRISTGQEFNVHLELGRAHESQGQFEAAVSEYQKALDVSAKHGVAPLGPKVTGSDQAQAHRRMAAALDRLGRFGQSEAHYRLALKMSHNDPKVWNDAGYSYYVQSRWDDAERCLKTAANLDPENPRIQTNLGLTLAAEGKTEAALVALTKAGGPAVGHANLGYLLAALGKNDLARQHYQTALEMQPELTAARQALAQLNLKRSESVQVAQVARPPVVASVPLPRTIPVRRPTTQDLAAALPSAPTTIPMPRIDPALRRANAQRKHPKRAALNPQPISP